MSVSEMEIDAFGRYAKDQVKCGANLSLQQLLSKWVATKESEEVADDIRQGIADIEANRGCSASEAFQAVRQKLRMSKDP